MRTPEPPAIANRIARIERALGKPVLTRGVRWPDKLLRGRIEERDSCILVEYRDSKAGYFWHYDILEELLALLEQGLRSVVLYDEETQRVASPPRYVLRLP